MQVREMELRDAAELAVLTAQLGYERTAENIRAWLAGVPAGGPQTAMVAEADGQVMGWIEACIERRLQSEPYALIGGLVVSEAARGKRIGQQLCQAAEQWARERGVGLMRVTSRSTRADAHRFYLRDGYEVVKTSVVFEKRLER